MAWRSCASYQLVDVGKCAKRAIHALLRKTVGFSIKSMLPVLLRFTDRQFIDIVGFES